jgi:hypothetical protein
VPSSYAMGDGHCDQDKPTSMQIVLNDGCGKRLVRSPLPISQQLILPQAHMAITGTGPPFSCCILCRMPHAHVSKRPTCSANRRSMLSTRSDLCCSSSGALLSSIKACAPCQHCKDASPQAVWTEACVIKRSPASAQQRRRQLGILPAGSASTV